MNYIVYKRNEILSEPITSYAVQDKYCHKHVHILIFIQTTSIFNNVKYRNGNIT